MLHTLAVSQYRSLRELVVPLGRLTVVTGANGSGKSNLYRALRLLAETAQGGVVAALAREGGLPSTLFAGPERYSRGMRAGVKPIEGGPRGGPVSLKLGFAGSELSYAIDLGMPASASRRSLFDLDAEIKREVIWHGEVQRPASVLVDRSGPVVRARSGGHAWNVLVQHLPAFDSMIGELADPQRAPELLALREQMRRWRFYDHFRSDPHSPLRSAQVATRTPVLAHDGHDLGSALQTIVEIGDGPALAAAVADAFDDAELEIGANQGLIELALRQPGMLRALRASELSDGTLRYLCWIAALLTPRPPPLMVLNEPETSLHHDLLPALARLIGAAAGRSQLMVVSHATRLVAALEALPDCESIVLGRELGETRVLGQDLLDIPRWQWPAR